MDLVEYIDPDKEASIPEVKSVIDIQEYVAKQEQEYQTNKPTT